MSLAVERRLRVTRERAAAVRAAAVRALFGTRTGLVVFLGAAAFVGLYWRVGVFVTDNYTLANALASLADGSLVVEEAVYGPSLETPGMHVVDGETYGRNYGQVAFALAFLWVLDAVTVVADPGIVFAAGWSLLVVALGREAGRVLDRPSLGASAGAVCGLVAFLGNAAVARPLADAALALAALGLSAIVATALAATLLYRLLARVHGTRTGVVAGAGLVAATPVGFWASVPKRHVYTVALFLGVCYAFSRSREAEQPGAWLSPLGFRALAYAVVGLSTWVHPGESFVFFLALLAVDVPTAPANDRRSLAVVAGAFALSLVPFLVTNALISGDPLRPPRMLGSFGDVTTDAGFAGATSGSPGTRGLLKTAIATVAPPVVAGPAYEMLDRWQILTAPFQRGVTTIVQRPESVYRTFVRTGHVEGVTVENFNETIELAVLEAGPVAAGVATAVTTAVLGLGRVASRIRVTRRDSPPLAGVSRAGLCRSLARFRSSPVAATDAFVALSGVLFLLVYIQRLPLHAQVTVRYLLVLYPVAVYAIARQHPLRRALDAGGRTALWTWSGGVLLGAQVFVAAVAAGSLGLGEAVQAHAVAGLAVAVALAGFAAVSAVTDAVDRMTAALLGLAAALGTDFLLLSGLVYFRYGQYALPASGELARLLSLV
jgi:hypothetical protein